MTDPAIWQIIATQGGAVGIAILALVMLNRVWADRVERERQMTVEVSQQRRELLEALNRNTEVIGRLLEREA